MAGLPAGTYLRAAPGPILGRALAEAGAPEEDGKMTSTRSFFSHVARAFRTFGSANRVASAVEYGRSPAPSDLERLGISVVAFGAINKN
jgi:hypothetical protein